MKYLCYYCFSNVALKSHYRGEGGRGRPPERRDGAPRGGWGPGAGRHRSRLGRRSVRPPQGRGCHPSPARQAGFWGAWRPQTWRGTRGGTHTHGYPSFLPLRGRFRGIGRKLPPHSLPVSVAVNLQKKLHTKVF